MSTDLTGLGQASLEAWRGVCERTISEVSAETDNVTAEEIADQQQTLSEWRENFDQVNTLLRNK